MRRATGDTTWQLWLEPLRPVGAELVALHLARELRQRLAGQDGQLGDAGELVDCGCLVPHSSVVRAPSVGSGGSGVDI